MLKIRWPISVSKYYLYWSEIWFAEYISYLRPKYNFLWLLKIKPWDLAKEDYEWTEQIFY